MADRTTIARPYAKAAFEESQRAKTLGRWSETLRAAATVVQDPRVKRLLGNPAVRKADLAAFVADLAGPQLDETGRNFVRTLADNRRLAYLPEISALFDQLKNEAEGVVDVTVTSAAPLVNGQLEALSTALQRRLKRQIRVQCHVDPALIGGAVLRAGDLVIDGSLRARLERIAYELTA
ncbi:MAG TPA: F0F1 ATP synthase subunit delta [Steroidobacteraceae bacterium]|nr:F0F1 ATP synthase subunit delta [Steroidobacteraceae bacterium]